MRTRGGTARLGVALLSASSAVLLATGCPEASSEPASASGGGTTSSGSSGGRGSGGSTTGAACLAGYQDCWAPGGDVCTLTSQDIKNCGVCGNVCPAGEVCSDGWCTCNLTLCSERDGTEVCSDPLTDPSNCNGCMKQCPPGDVCVEGNCQCTSTSSSCDAGLMCCQGSCTDTTTDPFNCGGCGVVCQSGVCTLGDAGTPICACPAPFVLCGSDCVDPFTGGVGGIVYCGSDAGLACSFVGPYGADSCQDPLSGCGCDGPAWLFLACCPHGRLGCTLTGIDPLNCGGCGNVCDSGVCQLTDAGGVCLR